MTTKMDGRKLKKWNMVISEIKNDIMEESKKHDEWVTKSDLWKIADLLHDAELRLSTFEGMN